VIRRILLPLVILAACSSETSSTSSSSSGSSGTSSGTSGSPEPTPTPTGEKKQYSAPAQVIDASKTYRATLVTAKGTIELSLDAKKAPITVNNFVFLSREKFYDGLTFHRVEPGFVIQGGDPKGTGTGGPGYTIQDEASGLLHVEGALAMAKTSAPNSAGSQFYITLAPQTSLDGKYTVFGKVESGMDVVKAIQKGDVMTSITIREE
jgi:peptidyl-prolyl cis-trans isomerase B (cyclophilin B)